MRVRNPNQAPTVTISAPANNGSVAAGTPVTLTASAADDFDTNLSSATDAVGKTSRTTVTVTLNATPVITITAPANDASFEPGTPVSFTATATDAEDGALTSALVWTSSRDGGLGTGGSITAETLTPGTHVITAAATDGGGKSGRATVTIAINATPVVAITAPASGSSFEPGAAVVFTGTATDAEDGGLESVLAWTSSLDGVLGTGPSVSVTTLSAGTHTITASALVNAAPSVVILGPPDASTFVPGEPVHLAAGASDAEDGDLRHAISWSSSLDGPLGSGATLDVTTLRSGTHVVRGRTSSRPRSPITSGEAPARTSP